MIVALAIGFVGLLVLAAIAWWQFRVRRAEAAIADVARRGMSRERFPSRYVGADTRFGLRHDTPCRKLRNEQGDVVRICTPDGRHWNVKRRHVAHRHPIEA